MADEKNPSDKTELLPYNNDKLDIVLGTMGLDGNLKVLYVDGTRKKCQAKITLGSALDAVVEIPLYQGDIMKINKQIGSRGLSKEDVKKLTRSPGIRKAAELLSKGMTLDEVLKGKTSEKEEGKEKE